MYCNYYSNIFENKPIQIDIMDVYVKITELELKKITENIQQKHITGIQADFNGYDKSTYQHDKKSLPAVVFSGCFDRSTNIENQQYVLHTGRINIDIDQNPKHDLDKFYDLIKSNKIPYIEASAHSISGKYNGSMWINILVDIPNDFSDVSDYLINRLQLKIDDYKSKLHTAYFDFFSENLENEFKIKSGSSKDIKRLRYLSYDDNIFVNYDAKEIPIKALEMYLIASDKKQMSNEIITISNTDSDPYKIALKYAENKTGACLPGNYHNFLTMFSIVLNRMGISESDAYNYATSTLGVDVKTNCIEYPYKRYVSDFGIWNDWKQQKPNNVSIDPVITKQRETMHYSKHFMPLGFMKNDDGVQSFHFYSIGSRTIIKLSPAKMSKNNLFALAPMEFWNISFPKEKSNSFNIDSAVQYLIDLGNSRGYFNLNKIRGRGAWIDRNRIVIHNGDCLIVDSQSYNLGEIDTEYIYELGEPLNLNFKNPLKKHESKKLLDTLQSLSWEREIDATLLAGWLALAPVCGVLNWRPHIWITGGAGSGKSWINKEVLQRFTKGISVSVQGNTSEAGLREYLGNDALNVLFDEAEGENEIAQNQIQRVLQLMRAASSSDGGLIAKGTGNGAKTYTIRSCFAFCSIVPQATLGSDVRRITNLELKKGGITNEEFESVSLEYNDYASDDYVKRFHARIINLLPNLLKTIGIFTQAITTTLSNRAMGDQLGALIGGAYHLASDDCPTLEHAIQIVKKFDFSNEQGINVQSDEVRCLQHILTVQTKVETEYGMHTRTIGELIEIVDNSILAEPLKFTYVDPHLKRIGIKVEGENLAISTTSTFVNASLRGTPWAKNYAQVLSRIKGAFRKNNTYYSVGNYSPAILIPLTEIFKK